MSTSSNPAHYLSESPTSPGIGEVLAPPNEREARGPSNPDGSRATQGTIPHEQQTTDLESEAIQLVLKCGTWSQARAALENFETNPAAQLAIHAGGISQAQQVLSDVKKHFDR